ncbi:MAG: DUF2892 domain-containing protein [Candidatus Omnitrophica bacterium]|nr:DUF2892 domain-containing protein [Candidatus Omnitrophota bacterium]
MTTERIVRIVAGAFVLISAALSQLHSPWWLLFTAFVGLNLFQSGFTKFCPLEVILEKMGAPSCSSIKERNQNE